jgi:ribonuclease J
MATKIIMHSGLRTIGGVCVSVEHGGHRVVFDFGSPYQPDRQVFDGRVRHREDSWIADAITLGAFPNVDGVYPAAALKGLDGIVPAEDSKTATAVFASTLYLDHMAAVGAVADSVPVYLRGSARTLELAMEEVGLGVRRCRAGYDVFEFGEPVRVGEIEVLPIVSDAKGFGSCSFLVTTPDGTVHWTGNMVIDGFDSGATLAEIELLRERRVDVLFCDATRFSYTDELRPYLDADGRVVPTLENPAGTPSYAELDRGLFQAIASCPGLAVVNLYQRETVSIEKLQACASRAGRVLVLEPDAAHVVKAVCGFTPAVFLPDSKPFTRPADGPGWLSQVLADCPVVTREQIRAEPGRYLVQNSYRNILELLGWRGPGNVYIHLDGEPIGEFDPAWANMARIVEAAGFSLVSFDYNNVVGHAFPGSVKHYVDQVDPKVLVPCHSEHPERLTPNTGRQFFPTLGEPFFLPL